MSSVQEATKALHILNHESFLGRDLAVRYKTSNSNGGSGGNSQPISYNGYNQQQVC